MTHTENKIIPGNDDGVETNTETEKQFKTREEAVECFHAATEKLIRPNLWHQVSGKATADFQLTDGAGNEVSREVKEGDHFKIDIPGPGSATGEGYDWVRVEKIESTDNAHEKLVAIRVRPATNPLNEKEDVAHFFKDDATSSFIVKITGNIVKAGVYGRNEKPNVDAENILDKARNTAVAAGAISGFAKLQWKSLVEGLLRVSSKRNENRLNDQ